MNEEKRKTIEIERAQLEKIMQRAAAAEAELLEFLEWVDETLKKYSVTETGEEK